MDALAATLPDLAPLAAQAAVLEPLSPRERRGLLRDEAAALLDGLLVRVARGRGALDVAMGQGLAALSVGDRLLALGYSGLGDYARERLGLGESTARGMARLATALETRPILWEAVRSGEVSARKAQAILPLARGDAEAGWLERARVETVRALEAAVRSEAGEAAGLEAEAWDRVDLVVTPAQRATFDEAMALAGKVLGPSAPRWRRLEALCQEFLGAAGGAGPADDELESTEGDGVPGADGWLAAARSALEEETEAWAFLERVNPVAAPGDLGASDEAQPLRLDAELRRLGTLRHRWDEVFGHLAFLVESLGLWRDMCFADFGHYCSLCRARHKAHYAERRITPRCSMAWLCRKRLLSRDAA